MPQPQITYTTIGTITYTEQTATQPSSNKIYFGALPLSKAFFGTSEITKIYYGDTLLYEAEIIPDNAILDVNGDYILASDGYLTTTESVAPSVDPVLANNSWATIKAVCEAGNASNYWSVGDTKTDVGTDNVTRTMRICDMQGLYNKHVVFEQVEQESSTYVWNASTNVDDNSAYNNYNISNIRTSMNTTVKGYYSSALQSALTQTTVKVAKNGNSSTILDVTDYLFLPAEKEIFGSVSYSRSEEGAVLTQFSLYQTHNTSSFRIKQRGGQNTSWWLRSPYSSSTDLVCRVNNSGNANYYDANFEYGIAPCFAF